MGTKSFTQIDAWKLAHQFVLTVYKLTHDFPKCELFGLTSQFRRAAISVAANIAEGYKRRGTKEKLRFYNISQSSIEECRYYVILSIDLGYIKFYDLNIKLDRICSKLYGYMKSLEENCN